MSYEEILRSLDGGAASPGRLNLSVDEVKRLVADAQAQGGGPGFFSQVADAGLGAAGAALDWLNAPSLAVRSLMAAPGELLNGDPLGALARVGDSFEHTGGFLANLATAGMFDRGYKAAFGEDFTTQAESPETTDLVELYTGYKPEGIPGFAIDVAGGILTDPLTYFSGGGLAGARLAKGIASGTRAAGRELVTRSLLETAAGRAGLLEKIGSEAGDDLLRAINSGSLKGLAENSLRLADDAAEAVMRSHLPGPYRLSEELYANKENAGIFAEAFKGMQAADLVQAGGIQVGLPGAGKYLIPGSDKATSILPGALKHGAAPALGGEIAGGVLGLPQGAGAALGVGASALTRKFAPKVAAFVDGAVSDAWGEVSKVYSKFLDKNVARPFREFAEQLHQNKTGADAASLDATVRAAEGITLEQGEEAVRALRDMEIGFTRKTPEALARAHMAAAGVEGDNAMAAMRSLYSSGEEKIAPALKALGAAEIARPGRQVNDATYMLKEVLGEDRGARQIAKEWFRLSPAERARIAERAGEAQTVEAARLAGAYAAAERAGIDPLKAQELVGAMFRSFDKQQDDLVKLGKFHRTERSFYIPHVVNRELEQRFADAGVDVRTKFLKKRKGETFEEFEQSIRDLAKEHGVSLKGIKDVAVTNIADLMHSRQLAHNDDVFRLTLKQRAEKYMGMGSKLGDPEEAVQKYVARLTERMKPRGKIQQILASTNKFTKPLQTIYTPSFHVRNIISTWGQTLLDPELTLKDSLNVFKAQVADLPLVRALTKPSREQGDVYRFIRASNNPLDKQAQRDLRGIKIGRYTGEEVLAHAKKGILRNNFGEEILDDLGLRLKSIHDQGPVTLPGKVGRALRKLATDASGYVEDRARMTAFVALLEKGMGASEAIRRVSRMYVGYDLQGATDRLLRDVIPYARFSVGNTTAVIDELTRRPGLISGQVSASAHTRRDDPLAPEVARMGMAAPIGGGDYFGGFGMPNEAAAEVVNGLTSLEGGRRTLASTALPISLGLQKLTNKNFYFGGDFDRPAAAPSWAPAIGPIKETAYGGKEISPGMAQVIYAGPFGRIAGHARTLDSGTTEEFIRRFVTGAGIVRGDEARVREKAVKAWVEDALRRGEVGKVESFYQRGVSPEAAFTAELASRLRSALRDERKEKEAAKNNE